MERPNSISSIYMNQLEMTRQLHKLKLLVEIQGEKLKQLEEDAKTHHSYKDRKLCASTSIEN